MKNKILRTPELLEKLNSATKYPSIPTYHKLGERGALLEERNVVFDADEEVWIAEKVDGTNSRIIIFGEQAGAYIIGSREELLTYSSDLIYNPALGIVDTLRQYPLDFSGLAPADVCVVYGESYGRNIGAAGKYYSTTDTYFRVFDSLTLTMPELMEVLARPKEEIARWRDGGGQPFDTEPRSFGLPVIPRYRKEGGYLPATLEETRDLVNTCVSAYGTKSEGLIVRNADRSKIVKVRVEDYERHFKRKPALAK